MEEIGLKLPLKARPRRALSSCYGGGLAGGGALGVMSGLFALGISFATSNVHDALARIIGYGVGGGLLMLGLLLVSLGMVVRRARSHSWTAWTRFAQIRRWYRLTWACWLSVSAPLLAWYVFRLVR